MKRRGNVYEGSLNTIFFTKLNLITSFSIFESLCKKCRVQRCLIVKVRAVIKFLNAEGVTGLEIHRRLSNVYAVGHVMSLHHIYKWIEYFKDGQSDTYDKQQTGCLRDSINETITRVCTLLVEDHQFTISNIHREMAEPWLSLEKVG